MRRGRFAGFILILIGVVPLGLWLLSRYCSGETGNPPYTFSGTGCESPNPYWLVPFGLPGMALVVVGVVLVLWGWRLGRSRLADVR